jgi:crotonobetainyl-CoA:carnitine CoA-transferase CaiB-like acyl-CoA transferase
MAGLWDAQRTGVGRDIDISLLDTAVSMLSYFANPGRPPEHLGWTA